MKYSEYITFQNNNYKLIISFIDKTGKRRQKTKQG